MGKITVDGVDPKNEIDTQDSKAGPVAYVRGKLVELRVGSMGKELKQMRSEFRKDLDGVREVNRAGYKEVKELVDGEGAKANLIRKEFEAIKVKVNERMDRLSTDNLSLREEVKRIVEGAKVKDAVVAAGMGTLAKAIVKKALPWKKS